MQESLEQVGVIDMGLVVEAEEDKEGYQFSLPSRCAHICTLKVVDGRDVYVIALQARGARLTLYKVDADLSLSPVCELPFHEWDVAYKNQEPIRQVGLPLIRSLRAVSFTLFLLNSVCHH